MSEFKGLEVAIARHVHTKLRDPAYRKPGLLGILMGFDSFYKRAPENKSVRLELEGGPMRVTYASGYPQWRHMDQEDPNYDNRVHPLVRNFDLRAGQISPYTLEVVEPIDIGRIEEFKRQDRMKDYGMMVAEAAVRSFITHVDELLFPTTQAVAGAGAKGDRNEFMQFSYGLQNGRAGNAANGATSEFLYMGIDMHDFPALQALNVGDTSTGFEVTVENIMRQFILPMSNRGGVIDLCLCDATNYAALWSEAQATIQQPPAEFQQFAGAMFKLPNGPFVFHEPRLDGLEYPEIYFCDSSVLRVGLPTESQLERSMYYIEQVEKTPSIHILQGRVPLAFFNEAPYQCARGFNAAPPSSGG